MNPENEIKEFVLSFFRTINSDIKEDGDVYTVNLPEKYYRYFESAKIIFTFDKNIASERNCHLIIHGSIILSKIIMNCKQKGPISIKSEMYENNLEIRYYFSVNFLGIRNFSKLDHVDIKLNTQHLAKTTDTSEINTKSVIKINPKAITPSYITALNEIKNRYRVDLTRFLDDENKGFLHNYELFVDKYDSQMRELDDLIRKKEENYDDFEKINEFRFNTVEDIEELEKEKMQLIETFQEKHKILLEYSLVACEIIQT